MTDNSLKSFLKSSPFQYSTELMPVVFNACMGIIVLKKSILHFIQNPLDESAKENLKSVNELIDNLYDEYLLNLDKEDNILKNLQTQDHTSKEYRNLWLLFTLVPFDIAELVSRCSLLLDDIANLNVEQSRVNLSCVLTYFRSARIISLLLVRQRMSDISDIKIAIDISKHCEDLPDIPHFEWEV